MNAGEQTIEWLYSEQLKVDPEWSVRTPSGFTWWAHRQAQRVEVIGQELGHDGSTGYFVSVRTEVLRSVTLDEQQRIWLNSNTMPAASMAGLVYDEREKTLSLASLVRVPDVIAQWMRPLISVAAVLQLHEAHTLAQSLAEELDADEAESGPPDRRMREAPDEMASTVDTLVRPLGRTHARWSPAEFTEVVDTYMNQPPALLGNAGGAGFAVEFPFGTEESSLCSASADKPHAVYGHGLSVIQSFPVYGKSQSEGSAIALSLNQAELTRKPFGYGFGSYIFRDGKVQFVSFLPNVLYRPGLLPNLYFACAGRAREVSIQLGGADWTPESFSPQRSAVGRLMDLLGHD